MTLNSPNVNLQRIDRHKLRPLAAKMLQKRDKALRATQANDSGCTARRFALRK